MQKFKLLSRTNSTRQAIKELPNLPQLVSGFNKYSIKESEIYLKKYGKIIHTEVLRLS